ncbi:MAG TPA: hypothetical protein VND20_10020 [Candidatus Binataceae bacterium]|nr:hypothetical protein [Candidatus Binataceae bacterium]
MDDRRVILDLPAELWDDLARVAAALELGTPDSAALYGLAEWIAQRKSEIADRDPAERYFINQALDELAARRKP